MSIPEDRFGGAKPSSSLEHAADLARDISWGRTSGEKLFQVPVTHDMLFNLFSKFPPSFKTHSAFELITLSVAFLQCLTLLAYLAGIGHSWWFLLTFVMFRLSYNAGLGLVLKWQSEDKWFTKICLKSGLFDSDGDASKSASGKSWYRFLKRELSKKMGSDYSFERVPIEFNSWLLFRHLVDFILVNDFVAYVVFVSAFWSSPEGLTAFDVARYTVGIALIAFNIWVKLDAHRVVKDFAWYWGDFFFLVDKNLTFDGVFEMCFHPMYSVGYAGYYGLSLISNSYTVFFISLAAHVAQFLFLYAVEEPHIKKIYGNSDSQSLLRSDHRAFEILYGRDPNQGYFRRDLIVFKNFDMFRSTDLILAWSVISTAFLSLPFPSWTHLNLPAWLFIGQAVLWRIFHTFVLGISLLYQSQEKTWTRHFIKFGGTNRDAFSNWKTVYNFSLTMTYTSFIAASFKTCQIPSWAEVIEGPFLMRMVFGLLLILMHIWMSFSVFDALGDFGWFYGDFFINEFPAELHYTGIYRYLNNPEKTLGLAAFWGFALLSGYKWMFYVATFSHMANWWFLEYVESPHMQKIYGPKIRKESGLVKTINTQLALPVKKTLEKQKFISDVNKVLGDVNKLGVNMVTQVEKLVKENVADKLKSEVDKVMEKAKPAIEEILAETKTIVAETTARLTTISSPEELDEFQSDLYNLQLAVTSFSPYRASGFVSFSLGEPISVYWTAPCVHSTKDWIGVYKITANPSKSVTTASSKGCWAYLEAECDENGSILFSGNNLPWEVGIYEFRLHKNDKYLVMARTAMFEIKAEIQPSLSDNLTIEPKMSVSNSPTNIEIPAELSDVEEIPVLHEDHPNSFNSIISAIIPLYRRALNNTDLQPYSHFTIDLNGNELHAKRIAYGIKLMFGIEFSWKTIMLLEPTAERMAERIQEARIALAPTGWEKRDITKQATISRHLELIEGERELRGRRRSRSRRSDSVHSANSSRSQSQQK